MGQGLLLNSGGRDLTEPNSEQAWLVPLYQSPDEWATQHGLSLDQMLELLWLGRNDVLAGRKNSREQTESRRGKRSKTFAVGSPQPLTPWVILPYLRATLFHTPVWYFTLDEGRKKPKILAVGYLLPCEVGDKEVTRVWKFNSPVHHGLDAALCQHSVSKTLHAVNI